MKHIVIPTDFTVASLQPVHTAIKYYRRGTPLRITLLHLLEVPSGIQDLLTKPKHAMPKQAITDEFNTACDILKSRYAGTIQHLDIMVKYGDTRVYLKNLLQGLEAEAVWVNDPFKFTKPCPQSMDMAYLLKKIQFPVMKAPAIPVRVADNSLSELLVNDVLEMKYKMV